jgi:HEPN domain-containing protein
MRDLEQARALLETSRRDLKALRGMGDAGTFAEEIFGFHVQQAAEKALKAWLALEEVVYPKTHDLSRLLTLLEELGADAGQYQDLIEYNPYAVQLRYEAFVLSEEPLDRERAIDHIYDLVEHVQRRLAEVEDS